MSPSPVLQLGLSPSTALAAALALAHAGAASAAAVALPGGLGAALGLLILGLGFAAAWSRALLRGRRAPKVLEWRSGRDGSSQLSVRFADGAEAGVAAAAGVGVARGWVVLRLVGGRGRGLIVTPAMLPAGTHRLLRLWALWGRLPAGVAARQPAIAGRERA